MNRIIVIFFTTLILCTVLQSNAALHTLNKGRLINKHFFVSVPYYNSSDSAILIDVVINGKHYKFLLDTGAPLVISKSLQKELNWPLLQNSQTVDANGDSAGVKIVKAPDVKIGPLEFKDIPALVLDLESPMFDCIHFDGIIGSNMLRLLAMQVNKPEHKIYFADHIDSFRLPAGTISTALLLLGSQSEPHIVVHLNETFADTVLYDSGDQTLYSISKYKFDNLNRNGAMNKQVMAKGKGVNEQGIVAANTDELSSFLLKTDVSIGDRIIKNIQTEPNYSNQSRMGRELWNYGLVTMDYAHKSFYFSPYQKDLSFTGRRGFGFKYGERNGQFVVTLVWNNTDAADCGLQPGDEIIEFGKFIPSEVPKCDWKVRTEEEITGETVTVKYKNKQGTVKSCVVKKLAF